MPLASIYNALRHMYAVASVVNFMEHTPRQAQIDEYYEEAWQFATLVKACKMPKRAKVVPPHAQRLNASFKLRIPIVTNARERRHGKASSGDVIDTLTGS